MTIKTESGKEVLDWGLLTTADDLNRVSVVHKFGRNAAVGTSFIPIANGGVYRTPQVSGATALRVKAGNATDTAAGDGARKIQLQGLDETGALVTEEISTNGTSAGTASTTTFIRLFRAFVSESGTYATASAGSHAADIVIENSAGTEDWATISATDFARAQTEIGVYTVPLGKTAYIPSLVISTESTKDTDILMFKREGVLDTSAPYQGMRVVLELGGVASEESVRPWSPLGPFPALTDIGFMGKVATGTGEVDVDFEIVLVDD